MTCDDRDRRSSIRRVAAAGFPRDKWLGDFDYEANPSINSATINTLASADWVRKGQPRCLIGDSGTGKSHLLIGLGTAADRLVRGRGRRTRWSPIHDRGRKRSRWFAEALLDENQIGTGIYYPIPNHRLPSFNLTLDLLNTEAAALKMLSLPIHPSLGDDDRERIVEAVNVVARSGA